LCSVERLKTIKLLALDVDGVLTDGGLIYTGGADQAKVFHVQDGLGIRIAMLAGLNVAIITGNVSPTVAQRAKDLGIEECHLGARYKPVALRQVAERRGITLDEIAYVGDDINDLPAIALVGVSFAVENAVAEVKEAADFTTRKPGGSGAVREVIETILKSQDKWQEAITAVLKEFEREEAEGETAKVVG
jgi:3-deoxy-D-manno-octulosonate 8-phosphate phosphatase (KDO 8-P phosphatase)